MINGQPRSHETTQGGLAWSEDTFRRLVEEVVDYAIFLLDPRGHIVSWNKGAQAIKGYTFDEVAGRHFSIFYPQASIDSGWPQHELAAAARLGRFEDEGWRLRKDGSRFWASVIITALRNDDGSLLGFSKITRDLTERRRQEESVRQSEERFRLLVEGVQDYAIIMLDPEGRVSSWNNGAQRITGYRADEIMGCSFERFFTPEDRGAGHPSEELRRATLNRRSEEQGWRLRKDGARFWAHVVTTSLHDAEGRLYGFAKVLRDLSDRKRMESLEEQGRHLTEFLAMLAHELRNPLAPIRNALGIMAVGSQSPAQLGWAREVIERQTAQLARLVDDLLDVSRITRGKLRLQVAPMDVATAAVRALESSRPLIDRREQHVHLDLGSEPVLVHGDITRVTQVIVNLLNNAAKYTPEGGDIWVTLREEGADAVLSVRDNGSGIAPGLLDNIFDLFAQGERTLDRAEGGLGIGLTLARRIVVLHGGSVEARSEGAGKGAEFLVRLPRLDPHAWETGPTHVRRVAAPSGKRSILVVDDNQDAAESAAMLLRMAGHEVRMEHTGQGAIDNLGDPRPDVILLDIGLPDMDGYEVARRIREAPGGRDVRIFAMTGYGQEEDRRRSRSAGLDGHLLKPVMPADLFALVDADSRARG